MTIQITACVCLFGGMLFTNWAGRRRRMAEAAEHRSESHNLVNSAVFALLGLLIAFCFSSAYSRLDARRQMIVTEINAIGTAYLRTDLIDAAAKAKMNDLFRSYLAARIVYNQNMASDQQLHDGMIALQKLQQDMWNVAFQATRGPDRRDGAILLLPALNQMFDITTTRLVALKTYIPRIIVTMLFALSLICAYLIAYQAGPFGQMRYGIIFAFVVTFVLYVIMDIENPRAGLVRLDAENQQMASLSEMLD